jgi:hypothetical protein
MFVQFENRDRPFANVCIGVGTAPFQMERLNYTTQNTQQTNSNNKADSVGGFEPQITSSEYFTRIALPWPLFELP